MPSRRQAIELRGGSRRLSPLHDKSPVVVATSPSAFQALTVQQGSLTATQAVQDPNNYTLIYTPNETTQGHTDKLGWTTDTSASSRWIASPA
jgi:hypothetical protein